MVEKHWYRANKKDFWSCGDTATVNGWVVWVELSLSKRVLTHQTNCQTITFSMLYWWYIECWKPAQFFMPSEGQQKWMYKTSISWLELVIDKDSLFAKFSNKEFVSKCGTHTNVKQTTTLTCISSKIVNFMHPSATTTHTQTCRSILAWTHLHTNIHMPMCTFRHICRWTNNKITEPYIKNKKKKSLRHPPMHTQTCMHPHTQN